MVCFDIELAYPLSQRNESNLAYEQRLEHLRKHYRADGIETTYKKNLKVVRFAVCDEDAIGFLRDVPPPTFCLSIKILRTDVYLYKNYKATGQYVYPPHLLLLKQVYWKASQLQKWQPTSY